MGKKDNKLWLDDPEWEMLLRKSHKRPISSNLKKRVADQKHQRQSRPPSPVPAEPRAKTERSDTDKEVVVNFKFAIPKVKLPNFKKIISANKTKILGAAYVVMVAAGLFGAYKFYASQQTADAPKAPTNPVEQAEAKFTPLVPLKNLADLDGKKSKPEFRYDEEKKTLAYVMTFNGANLLVSQQALPEQLEINPGQLEGIARSINANVPIDTQKGKAYLGTDEETKTQVAVFATKEVLVFMRSNIKLSNDIWEFYINQLSPREVGS